MRRKYYESGVGFFGGHRVREHLILVDDRIALATEYNQYRCPLKEGRVVPSKIVVRGYVVGVITNVTFDGDYEVTVEPVVSTTERTVIRSRLLAQSPSPGRVVEFWDPPSSRHGG